MNRIKHIWLVIAVVFIGIQFIPVSRNNSGKTTSADFIQFYDPPEMVSGILKVSCYNCHSDSTDYPWYAYFQPVGLFIENHINRGKENLNLSEFGNYSGRRQYSKLISMIDQIEGNEMPLPAYTLIHRDAKLSGEDKKELISFLNSALEK
jgi:hypothetical protein